MRRREDGGVYINNGLTRIAFDFTAREFVAVPR